MSAVIMSESNCSIDMRLYSKMRAIYAKVPNRHEIECMNYVQDNHVCSLCIECQNRHHIHHDHIHHLRHPLHHPQRPRRRSIESIFFDVLNMNEKQKIVIKLCTNKKCTLYGPQTSDKTLQMFVEHVRYILFIIFL